MSVYQSEEYKEAEKAEKKKIVQITDNYYAVKTVIKLPLLGYKRLLEARGTPSKEELDAFKKLSKTYYYGTIAPSVIATADKLFTEAGMNKVPNHTILVDLSRPKEELWKNLEKKSARWGVKMAQKNGLECCFAEAGDIEVFYSIYSMIADDGKFRQFRPKSIEFVKALADTEVSKLFIMKQGEEIMAGGLILIDKPNSYAVLDITAVSARGMELQAMPFLYWNLIRYAKSKGLDFFDLGGYDLHAKQGEKLYNINKFKERFGGKIVEQPVYSTNGIYPLMRNLLKTFRFMGKWYQK